MDAIVGSGGSFSTQGASMLPVLACVGPMGGV